LSELAAAEVVAEVPADAPAVEEQIAPVDGEARKAEAARGRMRRAKEKLKKAKTELQLREIAREIAGDESGDSETKAEAESAATDTPAEPKALEPTPDQVQQAEELVKDVCVALADTAEIAGPMLAAKVAESDPQRAALLQIASVGTAAALRKDAGDKLAAAWAPLLAKYMPRVATASPWGKALAGTYAAAVSIGASIQAEAAKLQAAALTGVPPIPPVQAVPSQPAQASS
jgi:hypothetical protein